MGKQKKTIVIEIDPEAEEIIVKDEAGNERPVKSIMVFGGDAKRGILYLFGRGASADAAWAFKEGFVHATECGDAHFRSFYKQCACHMAKCLCPDAFRRETEADDLLNRWEAEDRDKGSWN